MGEIFKFERKLVDNAEAIESIIFDADRETIMLLVAKLRELRDGNSAELGKILHWELQHYIAKAKGMPPADALNFLCVKLVSTLLSAGVLAQIEKDYNFSGILEAQRDAYLRLFDSLSDRAFREFALQNVFDTLTEDELIELGKFSEQLKQKDK